MKAPRIFHALLGLFLGIAAVCFFATAALAQSFTIKGVRFDESAYFSESQLQAVVKPYVGVPISFEDLTRMLSDIQDLYTQAGVITAQAILPPQTLENGVLKVSLVEAVLGEVAVANVEHTSPEFLRRNISLNAGEKPDFEKIERDLRVFDLSHDVAPQISFRPGDRPGETIATITADEPAPFEATLSLDNFGRRLSGRERVTLFGRFASVTGRRDTLSFKLQKSQNLASGSVGYSVPVGSNGARVATSVSYSDASVISAPTGGVTIVSDTTSANLSYRVPFGVKPASAWIFEGGAVAERSKSTVAGAPFSDVTIAELFGTVAYQGTGPLTSYAFDIGLRVGSADALGTSPTEGGYALLSGGTSYARLVSSDLVFEANARFQFAPGANLPVARLFGVGGTETVRGYPPNVQSGDSGLTARLQLSALKGWTPENTPEVEIAPFGFLDAAIAVAHTPGPGSAYERLASVGAGFRVTYRDDIAGVALVGVPLVNTSNFTNRGSPRLYLGLDYTF